MKKNIVPVLLLFLNVFALCGQQVTIIGKARPKTYSGKEMLAFRYADYISYAREILETDTVKADGSFILHVDIESPQRIFLRCNHLKAPLYVEPGRTYEIGFPEKDSVHFQNPNLDKNGDLTIRMDDSTELNRLITDFNLRYDDFWQKNNEYFVVKKWHSVHLLLDSFRLSTNQHYANVQSPYFHSYIDYSIASSLISTFESENIISKRYLSHNPILYRNAEYMTFFNQFFDKYFYQFSLKPAGTPVFQAINERASFDALMLALKPAPYLENDTLRELVLLKGLFENYNNKDFSQSRILTILEEVSKESRIQEHRLIAINIITHFTQLKRGTLAPEFRFPDKNGKLIGLSDFKGKYVYLIFVSASCTNCQSELKRLQEITKKYPVVSVISISLDDKPEDMKKMLKENPKWNWTALYAGKSEQIRHDYNILSRPYSYLIGPQGKLLLSPCPGPFEGLEDIFYDITQKKQKKYRIGE